MTRRRHFVVFAALLLVAQLLFGVMSGGAVAHDGMQHCAGCPGGHSSSMPHGMGSNGHDQGRSHAGSHCSEDGATGTGSSGCGTKCAMLGGGHCGTPASPALLATASISAVVLTDAFGSDRHSIDLPDSPLFDFLRPPTRG